MNSDERNDIFSSSSDSDKNDISSDKSTKKSNPIDDDEIRSLFSGSSSESEEEDANAKSQVPQVESSNSENEYNFDSGSDADESHSSSSSCSSSSTPKGKQKSQKMVKKLLDYTLGGKKNQSEFNSSSSSTSFSSLPVVENVPLDSDDESASSSSSSSSGSRYMREDFGTVTTVEDMRTMEAIGEEFQSKLFERLSCQWPVRSEFKYNDILRDMMEDGRVTAQDIRNSMVDRRGKPVLPVNSIFKIFIPFEGPYEESPRTFGDIKLATLSGFNVALCLGFHAKAFTDISLGSSCIRDRSDPSLTRESRTFMHRGEMQIEKVSCYVEAVVKTCKEDESKRLRTTSPDQETEILPFSTLFDRSNVVGYNIWYLFHDDSIDPMLAIDKQISRNSDALGVTPRPEYLSEDVERNVHAGELCQDMFDGNVANYVKYVRSRNKEISKMRQKLDEAEKKMKDETFTSSCHMHRQIVNRAFYYNLFVCQQRYKDYEKHYITESSDVWTKLNEIPNVHDDFVEQMISMHNVNHLFTEENKVWADNVRKFSICPEQSELYGYFPYSESKPWIFSFPVPELTFKMSIENMVMERFKNIPIPWDYSPIELRLSLLSKRFAKESKLEQENLNKQIFSTRSTNPNEDKRIASTIKQYDQRLAKYNKQLEDEFSWRLGSEKTIERGIKESAFSHSYLRRVPTENEECEESLNQHTLTYVTCFEEGRDRQLKHFNEISAISRFLNDDELVQIIRLLRRSGMRELLHCWNEGKRVGDITRQAIKFLKKRENEEREAFYERHTLYDGMDFYNNMIALDLLINHSLYKICNNEVLMEETRRAAYRSLHDHVIDMIFGTPVVLHTINFGEKGTGKSHVIEVTGESLLPGTICKRDTSSLRSGNVVAFLSEKIIYYDEKPGFLGPKRAGSGRMSAASSEEQQKAASEKTALTSHVMTHAVLTMNKDDPSKDGLKSRQCVTIKTPRHSSLVISANTIPLHEEKSMASRFTINAILGVTQKNGSDLTDELLKFGKDSLRMNMNSAKAWATEWRMYEHSLYALASHSISLFWLPYPNIDMFNIHWYNVLSRIKEIMPSVSSLNRISEAMSAASTVETIRLAINIVFSSPGSPLINVDIDRKEITQKPFQIQQIAMIQNYLFMPESVAYKIITEYVHRQIIPGELHRVALIVANHFCHYYTEEQQNEYVEKTLYDYAESKGVPVESVRFEDACKSNPYNNENARFVKDSYVDPGTGERHYYVDPNFVSTMATRRTIVELLRTRYGHNDTTADYFLDMLEEMNICVPYVDPRGEDSPLSSGPSSSSSSSELIGQGHGFKIASAATLRSSSSAPPTILNEDMSSDCYSSSSSSLSKRQQRERGSEAGFKSHLTSPLPTDSEGEEDVHVPSDDSGSSSSSSSSESTPRTTSKPLSRMTSPSAMSSESEDGGYSSSQRKNPSPPQSHTSFTQEEKRRRRKTISKRVIHPFEWKSVGMGSGGALNAFGDDGSGSMSAAGGVNFVIGNSNGAASSRLNKGARSLKISTYFLEHLSPSKVQELIDDTIFYNGIEERELLTGVANPDCTFTYMKTRATRGNHPLRVKNIQNSQNLKSAIFTDARTFTARANQFLGSETRRNFLVASADARKAASRSRTGELVFDGVNAEDAIYEQWMKNTVGITCSEHIDLYKPSTVNRMIRLKSKHLYRVQGKRNRGGCIENYPDSILNDIRSSSTIPVESTSTGNIENTYFGLQEKNRMLIEQAASLTGTVKQINNQTHAPNYRRNNSASSDWRVSSDPKGKGKMKAFQNATSPSSSFARSTQLPNPSGNNFTYTQYNKNKSNTNVPSSHPSQPSFPMKRRASPGMYNSTLYIDPSSASSSSSSSSSPSYGHSPKRQRTPNQGRSSFHNLLQGNNTEAY